MFARTRANDLSLAGGRQIEFGLIPVIHKGARDRKVSGPDIGFGGTTGDIVVHGWLSRQRSYQSGHRRSVNVKKRPRTDALAYL